MAARYKAVYRDGRLVAEYERGELTYVDTEYYSRKRSVLPAPMLIRDIGEYVSPLDGAHITSRSHHRDHMRAHDVVEVGNEAIGKMQAASMRDKEGPAIDRELGEAIKRRVEEVQAMPQAQYDEHVNKQAYEHAEIASLITAEPAGVL